MNEILKNIKKARMKMFYKNGAIFFAISLFGTLIILNSESDFTVPLLVFSIPVVIFGILTLKYLVLSFKLDNCNLFFRLNKYGTKEHIAKYFCDQIAKTLFEDEKVIVTPELFINKNNYEDTFLNSEILDIEHLIHKVNTVIDFISITILYSDGKYYKIKYKRPLGFFDMEEKAKSVLKVANTLAVNCENLRSKR